MSLTRDDMLRELELLPAWKLREQAQTKPASPSASSAPAAEPGSEPRRESSPEPAAVMEHQAEAVEVEVISETVVTETAMLAEAPDAPWEEMPVFDEMPGADDELPPLTTTLGVGRRDSIMKLDWQGLQACVPDCQACGLAKTRTQTVFGVGDPKAEWLIIGEAPGAEEDKRGEPFVGQAGKLLDNMLAAIKLKRGENVYIANVLKCRPPENRDPHGEEVEQCDPFLKRQVELIQPKLILALGKFAAQSLLGSDDTIAAMRGKLHAYNGVPVIVTYHPAYLLRNLMDKAKAWEDLCFAVKTMRDLQASDLQSPASPPSSQLAGLIDN
jgi:uracil-DNA glycosylase family 4